MQNRFLLFLLVIGIPYLGVVGMFPFYNRAEPFILGFPFIYFWLFSCIPLTSLCMYIAFKLDPDNKNPQEHLSETEDKERSQP